MITCTKTSNPLNQDWEPRQCKKETNQLKYDQEIVTGNHDNICNQETGTRYQINAKMNQISIKSN